MNAFQKLKVFSLDQAWKDKMAIEESLKELLSSLLNSVHSEPKFFETTNIYLNTLTQCQQCEFLLLDKAHKVAYSYPAVQEQKEVQKPVGFLSQELKKKEINVKENLITFNDYMPSVEDREISRIELPYKEESVLNYVIHNKEPVQSWNLPHISLYNRNIDVPLSYKDQRGSVLICQGKLKFDKFVYFPIVNSIGDVDGIIRIFLQSNETFGSEITERLNR